jgi:hypothetical protein
LHPKRVFSSPLLPSWVLIFPRVFHFSYTQ